MARISVHVPDEVKEWVSAQAKAEDLSDSKIASRIIKQAFEANEPNGWNPKKANTRKVRAHVR